MRFPARVAISSAFSTRNMQLENSSSNYHQSNKSYRNSTKNAAVLLDLSKPQSVFVKQEGTVSTVKSSHKVHKRRFGPREVSATIDVDRGRSKPLSSSSP